MGMFCVSFLPYTYVYVRVSVCVCVCVYVCMCVCGLVQNEERLALLRTATDYHQTLYMDAMVGKGV